MVRDFISRKTTDKTELICDHLNEVSDYSKLCSKKFGVPTFGYLVGLLHDLGKFSENFQEKIWNDVENGAIHSQQGVKYILEQNSNEIVKEIIAHAIFAHHSGLLDGIDCDGERPMYDKLSNNESKLDYELTKKRFEKEFPNLDMNQLLVRADKEFKAFCNKIIMNDQMKNDIWFYIHLLTKAIYSGLIDADRTCAYLFDSDEARQFREPVRKWDELAEKLEEFLQGYTDFDQLNLVRNKISDQCLEKSSVDTGIYQLNVPTGGGKTLSSLRFALNHAKVKKKDHIVYVVPYLSVLDQTATRIKEALNYEEHDTYILEHHSNVLRPEEEGERERYKLLTSSWDVPIILTTMVQYLESVYSNKGSDLRKLHNMANSILIFDEVQALPSKCTHLFNLSINFLNKISNATIVLCTATQPILDKLDRPIILSDMPNLVTLSEDDISVFNRTRIVDLTHEKHTSATLSEWVVEKMSSVTSTLAIFNTKKEAEDVYLAIKSRSDCQIFYLSTNLCAAHRLEVLKQVKTSLEDRSKKTVLIATQLIEAGVDLSFECVIRAQAGLDNIVQAAGRCNRSGEFGGVRDVYVVNMAEENISRMKEIKEAKTICERIFREVTDEDYLSEKCLQRYYDYYFANKKNQYCENHLDYQSGRTTLYKLLSDNYDHKIAYENIYKTEFKGLLPAFKESASHFSVIDNEQISMIVPYNDEAVQLIEVFEISRETPRKKQLLEKLQKYSISVYGYNANRLEKEHAIRIVADSIIVLDKKYYLNDIGLVFTAELEELFI